MKIIKEYKLIDIIKTNTDEKTLRYLSENGLFDLFAKRIIEFLDTPNLSGLVNFPFTVGSFIWSRTIEGTAFWIKHYKHGNLSYKRVYEIKKIIKYENYKKKV